MTAEGVGALFSGVAALIWPLLILVVVIVLRRPIRGIAESVGARGGSVKLAGFEVTIAEATKQQQALIADLQVQLGALQNRLSAPESPPPLAEATVIEAAPAPTEPAHPTPIPSSESNVVPTDLLARRTPPRDLTIAWVDSHPQASAALQAALQDWGVTIVNLDSVAAALDHVARHRAGIVVARMTIGGDKYAGIKLAAAIAARFPFVTLYILARAANLGSRGHEALAAGAHFVTTSPAELVRKLASLDPRAA